MFLIAVKFELKFEYYVLYKGCVDGCLFLSNFIRFGEAEF
jgi:hypothetical protein